EAGAASVEGIGAWGAGRRAARRCAVDDSARGRGRVDDERVARESAAAAVVHGDVATRAVLEVLVRAAIAVVVEGVADLCCRRARRAVPVASDAPPLSGAAGARIAAGLAVRGRGHVEP